jgi:RNA polymerase sigma-70 factor (ECF subfamily)
MGHDTAATDQREDAVLVRAAAEGDSTALRTLYDRHAPWLMGRLARRCNDREVVLDALQDTFVAVWREAGKWRGDGDVGGWLWGIAFRRMASRVRGRKEVLLLPDWERALPGAAAASVPAAEDQVLLGVEYGDLAGALRGLSPEFRSVVQAVVLDGLTTREAGRLLGVRENTVKTRLHRAKAQLRRTLSEAPMEGWR